MSYFDEQMAKRRARPATETRPKPTRGGSPRAKIDMAGSFAYGLADTVTFGYLDEAGAFLDSVVLGGDYETHLTKNRETLRRAQEDNSGTFLTGQVLGGFVPVVGMGGRTVKGMALAGAASGGLYGTGSADGDIMDRLKGGAAGAALGGAAGYTLGGVLIPAAKWGGKKAAAMLRHGRDPRLTTAFKPKPRQSEDGADELNNLRNQLNGKQQSAATPDQPKPRVNAITGDADDVLEDGALISMRELLGDPGAARKALEKRLGKLSAIEAQRIAQRLEDAELDGNVIDDPHFRSLLGIDLSDTDIDTDTAMLAVELLEEASAKIIEKAGTGSRTVGSMNHDFRERLNEGVIMGDLEEAFKRTSQGITDTRVAQHAIMLAGVQFVRAKDKYLPLIQKGTEGAREELMEVLTKSAHLMAYARGIVGNAGRALRMLQEGGKQGLDNVADDLMEIESLDSLRKRVDGALKHLGDEDLRDLLGRLRTASDIERIEEVLLDAERAKDFSAWRRTMNSVSLFLRSNALTPATGLFNTISFIGHDFFRNGAAKAWAARNFAKAGKADDALALRFEVEVGRRVYWAAHRQGLKALFKRVSWETWGEVEKIAAVGWGKGTVASFAKGKRQAMLDGGYQSPDMREYASKPRLAVTDTIGFNSRLAQLKSGGAFGNIVYHLERAKAVAGNTLDALGGASMKLFTGAIDDWGREFIKLKETYALSARHAIREAIELGLPEAEMLKFAQKRAVELAELPPSDILRDVEAKLLKGEELGDDLQFLMRRDKDVDLEAMRTLFMDGPQTVGGRISANAAQAIDKLVGLGQVEGLLLPYIRTPIRLFERGLVSYTPWGKASKEVQDALKKGGVEAEIVKAQMEIGFMGIKAGMLLGLAGGITLTNGGWNNSANLDAGPPNRVNLPGGGYVEMGRLDPFSLTLALGGFLGQAIRAGFEDGTEFDAETGLQTGIEIAWLAIRDSVLEKSYLTGLQDVMEVLFAREGGGAVKGIEKILQSAFTRTIPLSGVSRQLTDTARGGSAPEAIGWVDQMLRSIPGGGLYLSPRIDPLGDEVDGRVMGIAAGSSNADPVKEQLRELGIDITTLKKADPRGFNLSSKELSELRRIRAHEAVNSDGLTMREALAELFADPYFQSLPEKDQKHDMVVETMSGFNEPARALLEERDPNYLSNREAYKSFADYLAEGLSNEQAEAQARADVASEGLPSPDL